jgi:hypothetical protein
MAQSEFIDYFFRDRLSNTGVVCFLLFLMVTVWAYCVRQLCLHNDDPVSFRLRPEPATKRAFFEFSLCLSRACLGKMIVFTFKWRKNAVFRRQKATRPILLPQKAPSEGRFYLDRLQPADETSSLT